MPAFPRVSSIVLPILRAKLPDVTFSTWGADIDHRVFPFINIRVVGGSRNDLRPNTFGRSTIEMTAYTDTGLPEAELLYMDALEVLYEAVDKQTQTDAGYLHSIKETMGMTQFGSLFADSWRVQGLIQLGVRPPQSIT